MRCEVLHDAMIEFNVTSVSGHQQQHQEAMSNLPNNSDNIRLKLLKKYSIFTGSGYIGIENEVNNFINLKHEVDDVLLFWRAEETKYPNMAKLAKVILSKPASSAKSESAFSVAGVLLSKTRSNIEPLRAQKVLFIHDNYNLCKTVI